MSENPMSAYEMATLFHVLANTYGVCHSVSVEQPRPRERVEAATLFVLDDFR